MERNPNKISWFNLSHNPNAIHLLFDYDYMRMKENRKIMFREITEYVFTPSHLINICEKYGLNLDKYFDII